MHFCTEAHEKMPSNEDKFVLDSFLGRTCCLHGIESFKSKMAHKIGDTHEKNLHSTKIRKDRRIIVKNWWHTHTRTHTHLVFGQKGANLVDGEPSVAVVVPRVEEGGQLLLSSLLPLLSAPPRPVWHAHIDWASGVDSILSILYFISHTAIQFILIIKLSTASINCTKCPVVFILIIHNIVFGNVHVLWN